MTNKSFLLFTALLLAGCASDPVSEGAAEEISTEARHKIVNVTHDAAPGQLLVYFDNAAIADIEGNVAAATRAGGEATRSGIATVDGAFSDLGVTSFSRVFAVDPRNETATREAGLHKWYFINFNEAADLDEAAQKLSVFSEVQRIQFNTRVHKASDCKVYPLVDNGRTTSGAETRALPFNDPDLDIQWHYINTGTYANTGVTGGVAGADINVEEAWKLTAGDPRIIVAVVDEGVKYTHPDLAANMWVNQGEVGGAADTDNDGNGYKNDVYGYNFAAKGPITWDKKVGASNKWDTGHGTHVAGTVAAVNNNGTGVCGVAGGTGNNDGVRIMSCQIFSSGASASGTNATSAAAIKYAADNGASIIQCSYGYDAGVITSDSYYANNVRVEYEAIQYFMGKKNNDVLPGGLVIFASGNDAKAMSGYPGAYREYISVTAFSPRYTPAYYTNYGPGCNIAAPGGDASMSTGAMVLSTIPSELNSGSHYAYMQGTSMSCPHMSGVAALGLSYALAKGKTYTREQFNTILLTSVNNIDQYLTGTRAKYYEKMGSGSIDAYQVLMQIEGTPMLKVPVGSVQNMSLNTFFGGQSANLTYTGATMSAADMEKLGITEAPAMVNGKLQINCTKPGVARITVKVIAGGDTIGTGTVMGGIEISKEFAIIARTVNATNGGWL